MKQTTSRVRKSDRIRKSKATRLKASLEEAPTENVQIAGK